METFNKNFGIDGSKCLERTFISLEYAINVSEDTVVNFCMNEGIDEDRATMAGIVVEELATNVVRHGAKNKNDFNAYVHVYLDDKIIVHICDDTPVFNPLEQLKKDHDYAEENVGLRLVQGIAKDFEYNNSAGFNNVIITL